MQSSLIRSVPHIALSSLLPATNEYFMGWPVSSSPSLGAGQQSYLENLGRLGENTSGTEPSLDDSSSVTRDPAETSI